MTAVVAGTSTSTAVTGVCALPTGTTAGDVLLISTSIHNSSTVTFPAGSTLIHDTGQLGSDANFRLLAMAWRVATAADITAGSLTVPAGTTPTRQVVVIHRVAGANPTTPIDAYTYSLMAANTTVTWPNVTTLTANTLLLLVGANSQSSASFTATPAGTTTRADIVAGTAATNGLRHAVFSYDGPSSASAVTPPTATYSGNTYAWPLLTVAVKEGTPDVNAPTVSAGADKTFFNGYSTTLDGSAAPAAGRTIATYKWEQIAGPTVALSSTAVPTPTVSATFGGSTPGALGFDGGVCQFLLTVTDSSGTTATDSVTVTVASRKLQWSGREWVVKTPNLIAGPDDNWWGDTSRNVSVDEDGVLTLRVAQNPDAGNRWECGQVWGTALGYGTYRWTVENDLRYLDENLILGLFIYDSATGSSGNNFRELDIEFGRKLIDSYLGETECGFLMTRIAAFTEDAQSEHFITSNPPYTVEFTYEPGQCSWTARDGRGVIIGEHLTTSQIQTPGQATVRMNLWMRYTEAPTDGQPAEARISNFTFIPNATVARPKAEKVAWDFRDGAGLFSIRGGFAGITDGQMVVQCANPVSFTDTGNVFDIGGSSVDVEVAGIHNTAVAAAFSSVYLRADQFNWWRLRVTGNGSIVVTKSVGTELVTPVESSQTLVGHSAATRFWRFREAGGSMFFDTSPDRVTWTERGSTTHTLTAAQLKTTRLRLESGFTGTATSPGALTVAAYNHTRGATPLALTRQRLLRLPGGVARRLPTAP